MAYDDQNIFAKILRGELPLEVQDLEDEIIGLTTRLEHFDAEIKVKGNNVKVSGNLGGKDELINVKCKMNNGKVKVISI